jgi:hypothetical protein
MAVDFWADKYWNGKYFNTRYFGADEEVAGAMSASLSGSGSLSANLTAYQEETPALPKSGKRRRRRLVVAEIPLRAPEPIVVNIAASLSGAGTIATRISAIASMSGSMSGSGQLSAALGSEDVILMSDNNFWLFAA